jgi:7-cyano-7-deazaguanine reductase
MDSPLGKATQYVATYTPSLLYPMERKSSRDALGIYHDDLPFKGSDSWTCYELTWLNEHGMPEVGALRLVAPARSDCVVESKSLKLYLNSYAQTRFEHRSVVLKTLNGDLSVAFRSPLIVELLSIDQLPSASNRLPGLCLDGLPLETDTYDVDAEKLAMVQGGATVRETLFTNLFRSVCPVTGQPDMASVMVQYTGPAIDRLGLLAYLVSYRNHGAFHEETVERIFTDVMGRCAPDHLSVYARFQRRGGIDINPWRSTEDDAPPELRLVRQ